MTDESYSVAKMIRERGFSRKFRHSFDVWHKAKNIGKKLKALALKHKALAPFVGIITNHFWYSAQTCKGKASVLIETFLSCILHLANVHAWTSDPLSELKDKVHQERNAKNKTKTKRRKVGLPFFTEVNKCAHPPGTSHRRMRGMKWLDMASKGYYELFKALTDTRLCNTLKMCATFLHTGGVEVYHNVRLKLLPKRTAYSLTRMIVSGLLIAIEVNYNLDNVDRTTRWKWNKARKKYVTSTRVLSKDYSFRQEILTSALDHLRSGQKHLPLDLSDYIKKEVPANINAEPKPSTAPPSGSRYRS